MDEGAAFGVPAQESRAAGEAVQASLQAAGVEAPFHCVPLESVFCARGRASDAQEAAASRASLTQLLAVRAAHLSLLELKRRRPGGCCPGFLGWIHRWPGVREGPEGMRLVGGYMGGR